MKRPRPVTIVGGGIAGLSLGIGLRQQDVPVTVWEAGGYPRHRVCGEFISGAGQDWLEGLGLLPALRAAGAVQATTAAFFLARRGTPVRTMPKPALCLSRYRMDAVLAQRFQALGGELRPQARWSGDPRQDGVVLATGRRLGGTPRGQQWYGVKAHVTGVALDADLEMHVGRGGYVGLCRLDGQVVNVCGLFAAHRHAPPPQAQSALDRLRGEPGSILESRLRGAAIVPGSSCAVAGLSLKPVRAGDREECVIGDALTLIPPLTGNGMSMALEAAQLACGGLERYSRGEQGWQEMKGRLARLLDARFRQRLDWARLVQAGALNPATAHVTLTALAWSPHLFRVAFHRTRA